MAFSALTGTHWHWQEKNSNSAAPPVMTMKSHHKGQLNETVFLLNVVLLGHPGGLESKPCSTTGDQCDAGQVHFYHLLPAYTRKLWGSWVGGHSV